MKKLKQCKNLIGNKKGESLVESVVSIAIFSILIVMVVYMLNTSIQITKASSKNAKNSQEFANNLKRDNLDSGFTNKNVTIDINSEQITVNVKQKQENGYTVFKP